MHTACIPMVHAQVVFHYLLQTVFTSLFQYRAPRVRGISNRFGVKLRFGCEVTIEAPPGQSGTFHN
ncbi:hypothetical protein D3C79_1034520 [compost metagenome]